MYIAQFLLVHSFAYRIEYGTFKLLYLYRTFKQRHGLFCATHLTHYYSIVHYYVDTISYNLKENHSMCKHNDGITDKFRLNLRVDLLSKNAQKNPVIYMQAYLQECLINFKRTASYTIYVCFNITGNFAVPEFYSVSLCTHAKNLCNLFCYFYLKLIFATGASRQ